MLVGIAAAEVAPDRYAHRKAKSPESDSCFQEINTLSANARLLFPRHHKLGRPQQSPLDLGVREGANRFLRRLRIACCPGARRFQRSVAPQYFHNLRVSHAIKSP